LAYLPTPWNNLANPATFFKASSSRLEEGVGGVSWDPLPKP
jgi:hypothetical protein